MVDKRIEHLIGHLQGTVEAIKSSVDRAEDSRSKTHGRINALQQDVATLGSKVDALAASGDARLTAVEKQAADSKVVTDDMKRLKQMGIGAIAIIGIGASAIGAIAVKFFDQIAAMMRH